VLVESNIAIHSVTGQLHGTRILTWTLLTSCTGHNTSIVIVPRRFQQPPRVHSHQTASIPGTLLLFPAEGLDFNFHKLVRLLNVLKGITSANDSFTLPYTFALPM